MANETRAAAVYVEAVVLPDLITRAAAIYVEVVVEAPPTVTDMWQVHLITGAG